MKSPANKHIIESFVKTTLRLLFQLYNMYLNVVKKKYGGAFFCYIKAITVPLNQKWTKYSSRLQPAQNEMTVTKV